MPPPHNDANSEPAANRILGTACAAGRSLRRARGTNAHLEDAEIGNADLAALLQDATDVGDEAGEYGDRLLFGYAMIVSCPLGQMLQGDNRR